MASILCDVTLWLEHAKEVRALYEMTSDAEEKEQMLVVAAGFDRIAELAKEQAMLQKQCHRSNYRPAHAARAQKRRARKNAASKARRARPFLTKRNERLSLFLSRKAITRSHETLPERQQKRNREPTSGG
jgi:hypothetical protein